MSQCDRCEDDTETTKLYRDGHVWGAFCDSCHDAIAEFALNTSEETQRTPQDVWEENNSSFSYDPPEKPGDLWSSEEYQELHDRVISRRVQWFCDKCTGQGPIRSLEKARRHVERQHGSDLINQYETPREELEAATDGGEKKDHSETRSEENHTLADFDRGTEGDS